MKIALASLLLTACAQVTQPSDDIGDETSRPVPAPKGGTFDTVAQPDPEPQPLAIEPPHAATSPTSLFALTFAQNNAPISSLIRADSLRFDVVEQRIVTATDDEVELVVELAPPTGTFSRVLVSDTVPAGTATNDVLCAFGAPECVQTAPQPRETASDGPITASQWHLVVLDELTNTPVSTCTTPRPNAIECVLPPRAGIAYRIVASANGFANLWDGTPGLAEKQLDGTSFTGAIFAAKDHQCFDFAVNGQFVFCSTRLEFTRFGAIDRATLDFDPIALRIAANGTETEMTSPALLWDPGNDNVPGAAF